MNAQLAALFQDDSESLSEIACVRHYYDGAEHHRSITLRFASLSPPRRVLTDVIRPLSNKSNELSESGFVPVSFPVFTA